MKLKTYLFLMLILVVLLMLKACNPNMITYGSNEFVTTLHIQRDKSIDIDFLISFDDDFNCNNINFCEEIIEKISSSGYSIQEVDPDRVFNLSKKHNIMKNTNVYTFEIEKSTFKNTYKLKIDYNAYKNEIKNYLNNMVNIYEIKDLNLEQIILEKLNHIFVVKLPYQLLILSSNASKINNMEQEAVWYINELDSNALVIEFELLNIIPTLISIISFILAFVLLIIIMILLLKKVILKKHINYDKIIV